MKKNMSVLAAIVLSMSMAAPAFAQSNDGSADSGANNTSGSTGTDPSSNLGAAGDAGAGNANDGSSFDADNNGQVSLGEFNAGVASQTEQQRQQTLNDLGDEQFKSFKDECGDKPAADVQALCESMMKMNR